MASITDNSQFWGSGYQWSFNGDEWSASWGSARAQWHGCLLPRVFPFLGGRILEIAPGHGRWTQFLHRHCDSLIGIDVTQQCAEHCAQRFAHLPQLQFQANDGFTFPMIEDQSIDFAFSFDSLVHAEADVMKSYACELARVLKPGGVAFLHHSNLAGVPCLRNLERLKARLKFLPIETHWRAQSMSANLMRSFVRNAGMSFFQQEIIPWGDGWPLFIDCLSTIVNTPGSQCPRVYNPRFMHEAAAIKRLDALRPPKNPAAPAQFQ